MKGLITTALALTLAASAAMAADTAAPLPAGKPAGVKQAQNTGDKTLWIVGAAAIAGAGIGLAVSGGDNNPGTSTTPVTTGTAG